MDVELRHLRYFVAVAEARHFGRAADALHIAQPPLSRAIRALESELGVALLERTTRQVDLTPAGDVLLRDARRVLADVDETLGRVRDVADGREGVLRLGLTGSATYGWLPEIARVLTTQAPGIVLDISTDMLTPAQEAALVEGRLDLAVLRPPITAAGIVHRVVTREPLVLALPPRHRYADDPEVVLADLRDERFIGYPSSSRSVVSAAADFACRAAGFTPDIVREVPQTSSMLALVAAGLGVALMPGSVRASGFGGVVFHELPDAGSIDLAVAWRDGLRPPVVDRALEAFEDHGLFLTDHRVEVS